jgi:acetyl esterase/lipase
MEWHDAHTRRGKLRRAFPRFGARVALRLAAALALLALGCATADRPLPGAPPRPVVVSEALVYARPGGEPLRADVHRPPEPGPHPGVLLVHGGAWHGGRREEMHRIAMRLARRGYVAVSVDYRLAAAALYPAPLDDLQAALGWMRAEATTLALDPQRIAVWGYSAGAHLAALLALGRPETRLRAVVAGGLPADLAGFDNLVVRRFLGVARDEDPALWEEASPVRWVRPGAPPFFLYHGRRDRLVPPDQTRQMAEALAAAGVPHEVFARPGGHIDTFLDDDALTVRALAFLDRWVPGPPVQRSGVGSDIQTEPAGSQGGESE